MRNVLFTIAVATGLLASAGSALADHNSKNGEGSANMPNDIHNTRVDTRDNDDNSAFRDFVKYGEGSTTVNRFDASETESAEATESESKARVAENKAIAKKQNENQAAEKTAVKDQNRTETAERLRTKTPAASRQNRSGASRRGGGR